MSELYRIHYHSEPTGWWAECPQVTGWYGAADSMSELRELAREGLSFHLERLVDITDAAVTFHRGH